MAPRGFAQSRLIHESLKTASLLRRRWRSVRLCHRRGSGWMRRASGNGSSTAKHDSPLRSNPRVPGGRRRLTPTASSLGTRQPGRHCELEHHALEADVIRLPGVVRRRHAELLQRRTGRRRWPIRNSARHLDADHRRSDGCRIPVRPPRQLLRQLNLRRLPSAVLIQSNTTSHNTSESKS